MKLEKPKYKKGERLFWVQQDDKNLNIKSVYIKYLMEFTDKGKNFYAVSCYAVAEDELYREEELIDIVKDYAMRSNLMSFAK